jgi:hypothetical protein
MAKKPDAYFGAIPFRAFADRRLGDLDVRTLGVIAGHDNMSLLRGGEGCWAGTDRTAALANANVTNVSSSITKLEALGYLVRGPHPRDGRRYTFRVVYDATLDKAAFKGEALPTGKIPSPTHLESVLPADAKVPCPPSSTNGGYQPEQQPNIPEDTLNRPSPERAALTLRKIERAVKKNENLSNKPEIVEWLERMVGETEHGDPHHHWAQRLLEHSYFDDVT